MVAPDVFDPKIALTAGTVDGLTTPQLLQRLEILNTQASTTLTMTEAVTRLPSVRGVLAVLDHGRGEINELGIILKSIQRRAQVATEQINATKTEI